MVAVVPFRFHAVVHEKVALASLQVAETEDLAPQLVEVGYGGLEVRIVEAVVKDDAPGRSLPEFLLHSARFDATVALDPVLHVVAREVVLPHAAFAE